MKRAFSTLGCPTLTLEEVLAVAARCGMDAIEVRLDKEDAMLGYTLENAAEAKRMIDASGVCVCDLATGISIKEYDASAVARMEKCAALAAAVGARALRVFAGGFVPPSAEFAENEDAIAKTLREGAEAARKYGVQIWVETHSAYSTGATVAPLIARVNDPDVRVIWDIMHSIEFGEYPADTVRLLRNAIAHVHLKDGRYAGEGKHYALTALGAGDVNFAEIAETLAALDYDGYLSLEWELMWHPELGECYRDTDDLLTAYNALLDKHFFE